MLQIGDKVPYFECLDDSGNTVKSSDYLGSSWVLFFYPKADTPGCTAEACSLRDGYQELQKKGFKLVGVSADSVDKQAKFKAKYRLPFPLLADEQKQVLNVFGVWGEKKLYGKVFEGILRTTFVIDAQGLIARVITKVKTDNHASQVLEG